MTFPRLKSGPSKGDMLVGMSNGSSFIASSAQPLITPFAMTTEDERYARAVITANIGKGMLEAANHIAQRVADQQVSVAAERYVRSKGTGLEAIANLLGASRQQLLPFFRQAAEEGKRTRLNNQFAIELNPERLVLIHLPS